MTTLVIKTPAAVTDTSLPILYRDALFENANNGVLFLADLANRYCYDGGTPDNGKLVTNIVGNGVNGSIVKSAGQTIGFNGNGLDFSSIYAQGNAMRIPGAVSAGLWANQQFLICLYVKLPAESDWLTSASIRPIVTFAEGASYVSTSDLLAISFANGKTLSFRRQTDLNAHSALQINPTSEKFGQFAQIAYWRNASGTGARVKTIAGTQSANGSVGSNNVQDFSGKYGEVGVAYNSFGASLVQGGNNGLTGFKLYRTFVENLQASGRNPDSVLDADWARVIARGSFS